MLHGEFMIVAVIFDTASNLLVARPNDLSKVTNRLVWALALASLVIVPVLLLCESFDDMRGTSEERGRAGGETIAVVMVFPTFVHICTFVHIGLGLIGQSIGPSQTRRAMLIVDAIVCIKKLLSESGVRGREVS
ncbi:hypothetical protein FPQ18DRAFT_325505 [Pyronema domesticum]|nr:hypothetical protein FPQ18DRAFT_325505 [Pyronema domesticum]